VPRQTTFELLLQQPARTHDEQAQRFASLHHLSFVFADTAKRIARTLVEQCYAPVAQRRFSPVEGKGVAGGEKYIINNMFFKFVRDIHGIYGGDCGMHCWI
jgi:hypothetical protein